MKLEKMRHARRQLKLALPLSCCFASLVLVALLFLPAESFATCTVTNPNPNPNPNKESFVSPGDFNGDCKSDVLWQNSGTGLVYTWLMNGAAIGSQAGAETLPPSTGWVIQGVGDFNGDGMADVLWRNTTSGQVYIWFMNGSTIASQASVETVSPSSGWNIVGVGDFNDTGIADILWQNSISGQVYIWFMNGSTITSQAQVGVVSPSSGWNIVGIGDFNGDGKADILWENGTNGQVYVWLMNGTTVSSQGTLESGVPPSWAVLGVGDFDGNGTSDILWQNSASGEVYIWFMSGLTITSQGTPGSTFPPQSVDGVGDCNSQSCDGWTIDGVGDYDGSGRASILWRQLSTGATYIWLMNGLTIASEGSPGTIPAAWEIAALAPRGCSNQVLCNILSQINADRANGPFAGTATPAWGPSPMTSATANPAPSSEPGGALNPMVWDSGAATVAQNWASQCNFVHNSARDGGENLYASCSNSAPVTITGTDAVGSWDSEAGNYIYPATGGNCTSTDTTLGCGHYSQDVWRTTTAVGCGVQQCTTNSPCGGFADWAFVVCNFTPAGNVQGVTPY